MEPLLNLPRDQFLAALAELQLDPERTAFLVEQYDQANAPAQGAGRRGMMYNLLDNIIGYDDDIVTPGERFGAGVQDFASGLLSDPLGTGAQMAREGYETIERAMAPGATPMDVLGAAGVAMGAGGLLSRPAGSVGMGGRVVDFSERRQQRTRDNFANRIQSVVDDVASGNYQRRLDEAAFAAHREGLLPLPMGTRVLPPETYEMPGNWQVSGYFVDPNNPRRFGYRLENESGETFDAPVSDPSLGYSLRDPTRFGGGFTAFSGPRAEALQYQNMPQTPEPPPSRNIDPDEQARIDDEYRQLFGDELSANRSTTTGLLAASAAETPAQQIARLLREGRADDVTDDLMAQADPQEMYQLYVSGETGMDLPMDEASRMARAQEMGFDTETPLYHGTESSEITAFDPSKGMEGLPATFFSDSRDVARTYGDVGEYFARADYPAEFDFSGGSYTDFNNQRLSPGGLVRRVREVADDAARYGAETETDLAFDLEGAGVDPWYADEIDSVRMRNVVDSFGWGGEPANNLAVFDPRNIRRTSARFDPRLSHLANLNAANIDPLTGAAAMGASQQQDPLANLRAYLDAYGGLLGR
jgi:hypothetical protein